MRVCVMCVYWTLLLISVVSSGLLFLIVASEAAQAKSDSFLSEKNDTLVTYDNITLDGTDGSSLESDASIPKVQSAQTLKADYRDYREERGTTTVSASFDSITNEEAQRDKELDILTESLTQQPNLSQGISETGQAVVLTLVDTAAAELQSLAEPKITSEFRGRSTTKNSSSSSLLGNGNDVSRQTEEPHEIPPSTQIPSPPVVDEVTERPNDTDVPEDEDVVVLQKSIVEEAPEVVVVVRAEQKVTTTTTTTATDTTTEYRYDEEVAQVIPEEVPKVEEGFTTAAELNDSAARAQLVGGARDEAAAVVLDGIVTAGPTDPHEDIPSFSEWAQKRLEEAEKKKTHPNASVQNPGGPGRGVGGMKVRSKNYASPDCGAKIVAANPEARSARSVLVSTRDEYMLNTCTSRIWFVVELCEAIQAKKIELANFELFSSSPKDFSVYVSDRFPTRDWSPVGQFTAKDVKDTQSFTLHPHLFGKFIKVELHTYYGSEHFCPISLFRAYGTSEFEVLETETENQVLREANSDADDDEDSDEEEPLDAESGEPPRNLFGSARDAVLSIVKKAAEVLVKSSDLTGNNITKIQQSIDGGNILENSYTSCTTPRYTILCGNCSDQKFAKVFEVVSCRDRQLNELLKNDLVNRTLRETRVCAAHGVEMETLTKKDDGIELHETQDNGRYKDRTNFEPMKNLHATFLTSVFKPEYIVALCNVLATKERKVVMNMSYEIPSNSSEETIKEDILTAKTAEQQNSDVTGSPQIAATCTLDVNSPGCRSVPSRETRRRTQESPNEETEDTTTATIETLITVENLASQIKPTKTLSKEDLKKDSSIPILEPSKEPTEETMQAEVITTVPPAPNTAMPTVKIAEEPSVLGTLVETIPQTITSVPLTTIDSQESLSDNMVPDLDAFESGVQSKVEKQEQVDQDFKQGKVDFGEQEVKIPTHHDTFDTLLSDLKDLEGDGMNLHSGSAASASTMAQPTTSTTPQKESVFLRLSNRIKALERNMSLSGQYLEELSRRYKKQVEEMQRSLERAVSAMGEESRKGEERESKRLEEIAALREEIAILSKSVKSLLYDRDSWRGRLSMIGQHAVLICLEVFIVVLIISYCRRAGDIETEDKQQSSSKKNPVRRKSAENFGSHAKKTKKRRPSEIASHITGTYRELMIEDRCLESRKERKKKRKKEIATAAHNVIANSETKRETIRYKSVLNVIPGGTTLPSRRASSTDAPKTSDLQAHVSRRPESAPETSVGWFDEKIPRKERIVHLTLESKEFEVESERSSDVSRHVDDLSESNSSSITIDRPDESITTEQSIESSKHGSFKGTGILKSTRLSSPSFMKTALGSRKKRKLSSNDERWEWSQDSTNSNDRSSQPSPTTLKVLPESVGNANGSAANGLMEESDESRSSSATPTSGKKEKRSTGLKKMGRR